MAVIAYDRPVADFIAGLDATGHVTHTAYRKTSVTFHHNGGRLSLQGCLDVWKVRPASAHFQSDANGNIGQYVRVNEYAWATGTTVGNQTSISIEMADETLAPEWRVAEVTWKSAARLAGWLFYRVIGARPTRETVHLHRDWKSTDCAGPYMVAIRERLFLEVDAAYNAFANNTPTPTPRHGAILLGDDMPTVLQSASKPPILVVGGLFVELRSKAEQVNALIAYNQGQPLDADGVPSPVWVEDGTLANLIGQSQKAVG
jgi:hypothetical protein